MSREIPHQMMLLAFLSLFRALRVQRRFSVEQRETLVTALPQPYSLGSAPMDLQIAWNMLGRTLDLPLGETALNNERGLAKKAPLRPTNWDLIAALASLFRVLKATRAFRREKLHELRCQLLEPLGRESRYMPPATAWETIRLGLLHGSFEMLGLSLKHFKKRHAAPQKTKTG
ncbi:MAG: hypothetical protein EXS55_00245 [Candidatus Magasanikbacteria bacterium]|nr:hypothetical protein [Candidatus Magasanikbacteria bacterium]